MAILDCSSNNLYLDKSSSPSKSIFLLSFLSVSKAASNSLNFSGRSSLAPAAMALFLAVSIEASNDSHFCLSLVSLAVFDLSVRELYFSIRESFSERSFCSSAFILSKALSRADNSSGKNSLAPASIAAACAATIDVMEFATTIFFALTANAL